MAKTKAVGKTRQQPPRPGKRRGVKVYGGQEIAPGEIIVRQVGTKFFSGEGTGIGRDFTIFARRRGKVFFKKKQRKKIVCVL